MAAWVASLALVAGVTAYLLAYASQIGNKATTYWLCDLAIMILLFYGLLETLFVFATSVHVPGLLKEHYLKFSDPLAAGAYPVPSLLRADVDLAAAHPGDCPD